MLTKGISANVQIDLRSASMSGPASKVQPIPLETFTTNKDMGRIVLRRNGETVAAGLYTDMHTQSLV